MQIAEIMREAVAIDRREIASRLGEEDNEPKFRTAFSDARNQLVKEGIDFRPFGRGGLYRRAEAAATLHRSGNDRRAGLRKLARAVDKVKAVDVDKLSPHEAKALARAIDKSEAMLSSAATMGRKRQFKKTEKREKENPRADGKPGGVA